MWATTSQHLTQCRVHTFDSVKGITMPFPSTWTALTSVKYASVHRSIAVRGVAAVLACAVLVGCGGSPSQLTQQRTTVTVTPSPFTMGVGSNYQFVATVTGTTDTAVNWQVNGVPGGNASVGTIDGAGLYIAPTSNPNETISVTAIAQADGVTSGTAAVTLTPTDPLGSATSQVLNSCPPVAGVTAGTCYSLVLSCPGIADLNGYLWVNTPSGTPVGTVLLTSGGTSVDLYADPNAFAHGADVVNGLLAAGYVTVQTSFGGVFNSNQTHGWEAGPGGIRRVACRYATLAKWVHDNPNITPSGKPVCATGNSAGSALIGYALAHYSGDSIFTMVEPTSGPPYSRLDSACECNQPNLPDPCVSGQELTQCVSQGDAQNFIDPAYSSPICSQAVLSHSTAHSAQFLSDSIVSPEASMNYSNTSVHFVWGGLDLSSAPVMGQEWLQPITSPKFAACVADAPHSVPDVLDGAGKIVNDIVASCK
jgi:hypothetical protein